MRKRAAVLAAVMLALSVNMSAVRAQTQKNYADAPVCESVRMSESEYREQERSIADADTASLYAELPEFYNYGSSRGYADCELRSNSEGRQRVYERLTSQCIAFAKSGMELTGTYTINNEYPDGTVIARNYAPMFSINISDCRLTEKEWKQLSRVFLFDNPQFYFLSGVSGYRLSSDKSRVESVMLYVHENAFKASEREHYEQCIEKRIEEYRDEAKENGYDCGYNLARMTHDKLIEAASYEYEYKSYASKAGYAHTIIGVFDEDESTNAVCEGYSKAFSLMMNMFGIENVFVVSASHAWNMAMADDGNYYNIDITWDEAASDKHRYFMKGASFYATHTAITPYDEGDNFLYEIPRSPEKDYTHVHILPTERPSIAPTEAPKETLSPVPSPTPSPTTEDEANKAKVYIIKSDNTMPKQLEDGEYTIIAMDKAERMYCALYDSEGRLQSVKEGSYSSYFYASVAVDEAAEELRVYQWRGDNEPVVNAAKLRR